MPRPSKFVLARRRNLEKIKRPGKDRPERRTSRVSESESPVSAASTSAAEVSVKSKTLTAAGKRKKLTFREKNGQLSNREYIIIRKDTIERICKDLACGQCYTKKLKCIFTCNQADTTVKFKCSKCNTVMFNNAKEHKLAGGVKGKHTRVVTMMMVYFVMLMGCGYSGIERLCALFSMRHFIHSSYLSYAKIVTEKAIENAKDILERSRRAVIQYYRDELGIEPDANGVYDIDVAFDGSVHQGHLGLGAVIETNTGLIVDYETLCTICSKCNYKQSSLKRNQITAKEYGDWKKDHDPFCHINYRGTSEDMKGAAASRMWERSMQHDMRYVNFISDSDNSAYLAVKRLNEGEGPYGRQVEVKGEKSVSHFAKRLGGELRKLRSETSSVALEGGKKKRKTMACAGFDALTDDVIVRMQHYFGLATRQKANTTVTEMRDSIMASFHHCSSTDSSPAHHLCPRSADSWCFYQRALATGEIPRSHKDVEGHFELEPDQLEQVKQIYDKLTTGDVLLKFLRGWTSNRNKSLHSRIWRYCPKNQSVTKMSFDFAVAQATSNYNAGYVASSLSELLGLPYTSTLDTYLKKLDAATDANSAKVRIRGLERKLTPAPPGRSS